MATSDSAWADAADDLVGKYENHLYDGGGKNGWHRAVVHKIDSKRLRWINKAGARWRLSLTADKTRLAVGTDCPLLQVRPPNSQGQLR